MGRLRYLVIGSLDGYLADRTGDFSWAQPDPEVHAFVNARVRDVGTLLYGRRTYELMTGWENDPSIAAQSAETAEFADLWRAKDKVVHSSTLPAVSTRRTTLVRRFDPAEVARLKTTSSADLAISGPTLAQHAFAAGLVDEVEVVLAPLVVAGGLSFWPTARTSLRLQDERRFGGGFVWLRFVVA